MCTVYCIRYAEEICNVVGMGLPWFTQFMDIYGVFWGWFIINPMILKLP